MDKLAILVIVICDLAWLFTFLKNKQVEILSILNTGLSTCILLGSALLFTLPY
jgi:hypothetical protein